MINSFFDFLHGNSLSNHHNGTHSPTELTSQRRRSRGESPGHPWSQAQHLGIYVGLFWEKLAGLKKKRSGCVYYPILSFYYTQLYY